MADPRDIKRKLEARLAREAIKIARIAVGSYSRTLARSLKIEIRPDGAYLVIPHYWAVYVHDGRRGFSKPGGFLIYYRNPAQDPRFNGRQTPERARDVRPLTPREFREAKRLNRVAKKRRRRPPVIITRAVGPVRRGPTNFFENNAGMASFISGYRVSTKEYVRQQFLAYLRPIFKPGVTEKRVLRLR